jgi:hypothetical protein
MSTRRHYVGTSTESVRLVRMRRQNRGLCIDCGQPRGITPYLRCRACRVRHSNYETRKHAERKLWLMFAAGIGAALSPLPLNRGDGT